MPELMEVEVVKETKCERCGMQFSAEHFAYKYCSDECREIAGLERRLGRRVPIGGVCDGDCCEDAERHLYDSVKGWIIIQRSEYGVKTGILVDHCPWCGGKLE